MPQAKWSNFWFNTWNHACKFQLPSSHYNYAIMITSAHYIEQNFTTMGHNLQCGNAEVYKLNWTLSWCRAYDADISDTIDKQSTSWLSQLALTCCQTTEVVSKAADNGLRWFHSSKTRLELLANCWQPTLEGGVPKTTISNSCCIRNEIVSCQSIFMHEFWHVLTILQPQLLPQKCASSTNNWEPI